MHLFDVMVANQDRNLGNLVGESSKNPRNANVRLVAIDFEKAEAFRQLPLTTFDHHSVKITSVGHTWRNPARRQTMGLIRSNREN